MKFDQIGRWSEIKLQIIQKYAAAYSTILSKKKFHYVYIDAFAGAGMHAAKKSGELIPGSPLNALAVQPPFFEYHLIDLNSKKADYLRGLIDRLYGARSDVHVYAGDCNRYLVESIFPRVRYEKYWRGLCLLDPYGLHLDWEVTQAAGRQKTIDLFLNFPVMDMNRNVLWRHPEGMSPEDVARMTRFWGDESWRQVAYTPQPTLFGTEERKVTNEDIAESFRVRLKNAAGFAHVPEPIPMLNSTGTVVYYLFFASQQPVAVKIASEIFASYR